jgi:RNA polymerase sigma factor (sigma-70 family)
MNYPERVELFKQVRVKYTRFLASVLWKLTGDRELFTEAMQYALLGMWENIRKLNTEKAGGYIYRIALSANSKAWRNRLGRDRGLIADRIGADPSSDRTVQTQELTSVVKREISNLPARQGRALIMRYLEQQGYRDIAEELRCTEVAVRSHVSKAIDRLRLKLAALA